MSPSTRPFSLPPVLTEVVPALTPALSYNPSTPRSSPSASGGSRRSGDLVLKTAFQTHPEPQLPWST
jgi:hypothetical protein